MSKFKVGDKVRCIPGGKMGSGHTPGRTFIIKEIVSYENGSVCFSVGGNGVWDDSLELVSPSSESGYKEIYHDKGRIYKKGDMFVIHGESEYFSQGIGSDGNKMIGTLQEEWDTKGEEWGYIVWQNGSSNSYQWIDVVPIEMNPPKKIDPFTITEEKIEKPKYTAKSIISEEDVIVKISSKKRKKSFLRVEDF